MVLVSLGSSGVSVPLRGYFFEILAGLEVDLATRRAFPSPYGDIFLKCGNRKGEERWQRQVFPSPYGDIFLKYAVAVDTYIGDGSVSVPLRGYFFEILGV